MSQTNASISYQANNSHVVSIDGHGTMNSNHAKKVSKDESSTGVVMEKIEFYTSELHRLLDLVDNNKKSKHARKRSKANASFSHQRNTYL